MTGSKGTGSRGKKIALGLTGVVLIVVLVGAFFGPSIAAAFVPASTDIELNGKPARVRLAGVDLSWGGPQRVSSLIVEDAAASRRLADLRVESSASLLGLAMGSKDFGTVRLSGNVDVHESDLQPGPGARPSGAPAPSPTGAPSGPSALPRAKVRLEATGIALTYTGSLAPGQPPQSIKVDGLSATLDYDAGGVTLVVAATNPPLSLDVKGSNLTGPDGAIAPNSAQIDAKFSASLPGDLIEMLARAYLAPDQKATPTADAAGSPRRAGVDLAADLAVRDGRLRLTSAGSPIMVQGAVPDAVISTFAAPGSKFSLRTRPTAKLLVSALDVPAAAALGGAQADWRGATLKAALTTTSFDGSVVLPGSRQSRALAVDPVSFSIEADNFATGLVLAAKTRTLLDGAEAGSLTLDARAGGLLTENGALKTGLPGALTGELALLGIPTGLAQPLADRADIDLVPILGERMNVKVAARTLDAAPSAPGAIPPTEITAAIEGSGSGAWVIATAEENRVRIGPKGGRFEFRGVGPAAAKRLAGFGYDAGGDGLLIGEISDVDLPLVAGAPSLDKASGVLRAAIGNLVVSGGALPEPLELRSIDTQVTLQGAQSPKVALDWRMASRGRAFRAVGTGQLDGLLAAGKQGSGGILLTPEKMQVRGSIDVTDLPSDLAGLVPEALRAGVEGAVGPTIGVKATLAPAQAGDATIVSVTATGSGLSAQAELEASARSIRTGPAGATATLTRPTPLIEAALARTGAQTISGVEWRGPLALTVPSVTVPLKGSDSGAGMFGGIEGSARLQTTDLALDVRAGEAGARQRLDLSQLDITVGLDRREGVRASINGAGSLEGSPVTVEGQIQSAPLPAGAQSADWAVLKPRGQIVARGVPVALADLVDPSYTALLRETAGDRIDATLTAPAPGVNIATSLAAELTGDRASARTSFALEKRTLTIGQITAKATLTPSLSQVLMARFVPDEKDPPRIVSTGPVEVTVQPTAVELDNAGAPDLSTLRPVRASVRSGADIVVENVQGLDAAKRLSLGLRETSADINYDRRDSDRSEASLRAVVFDPQRGPAPIGRLEVSTRLADPATNTDAKLLEIDTAGVDALIEKPGLLSEALGATASVTVSPSPSPRPGAQAARARIVSPRLNTEGVIVREQNRLSLASPVKAVWQMPPTWANRYLAPPPEKPGEKPIIRFAEATNLSLDISRLSLGDPQTPLDPRYFALQARATAPGVRLLTDKDQPLAFRDLAAEIASTESPGAIAFSLSMIEQGGAAEGIRLSGHFDSMADQRGALTTERASITATARGSVPTAVVDGMTNSRGLLLDVLGPTTRIDAAAQNLSRQAGSLRATMQTEYAAANVKGSVESAGVFRASEPARATLTRITRSTNERILGRMVPILIHAEKGPSDTPATAVAEGLTLPTDGDARKINGLIHVDFGSMNFKTLEFLGPAARLIPLSGRDSNINRIDPFDVDIRNGVASYELVVTIGTVQLPFRGKSDLATGKEEHRMDLPSSLLKGVADLPALVTQVIGLGAQAIPLKLMRQPGASRLRFEFAPEEIDLKSLGGSTKEGETGVLPGIGNILEGIKRRREEKKKN